METSERGDLGPSNLVMRYYGGIYHLPYPVLPSVSRPGKDLLQRRTLRIILVLSDKLNNRVTYTHCTLFACLYIALISQGVYFILYAL